MSMQWIAHTGVSCPVSVDEWVQFKLADDDTTYTDQAINPFWGAAQPGEGRIVAYRLVPFALDTKPTNPKDALGVRKAPMTTVPMNVVAEVGVAMLEGAVKYGRHNYRGVGVRTSVYVDATMRHVMSFWEGEDVDLDSGLSHITKAIASLVVLRDAQMRGLAADDRPPRSAPFYPALNAVAGDMLDRHVGKNPKHWTLADAT